MKVSLLIIPKKAIILLVTKRHEPTFSIYLRFINKQVNILGEWYNKELNSICLVEKC